MTSTNRIFINHPKIGTVMVPKSRPGYRSKRYKIMERFMWQLQFWGEVERFSKCKTCNKILLNPHSILLHIGNGCESKKSFNKVCNFNYNV